MQHDVNPAGLGLQDSPVWLTLGGGHCCWALNESAETLASDPPGPAPLDHGKSTTALATGEVKLVLWWRDTRGQPKPSGLLKPPATFSIFDIVISNFREQELSINTSWQDRKDGWCTNIWCIIIILYYNILWFLPLYLYKKSYFRPLDGLNKVTMT